MNGGFAAIPGYWWVIPVSPPRALLLLRVPFDQLRVDSFMAARQIGE
jgi:hypothetical protein